MITLGGRTDGQSGHILRIDTEVDEAIRKLVGKRLDERVAEVVNEKRDFIFDVIRYAFQTTTGFRVFTRIDLCHSPGLCITLIHFQIDVICSNLLIR